MKPADKAKAWSNRASRLLKDLPATPNQLDLLQAHLEAVEAKLHLLRSAAPTTPQRVPPLAQAAEAWLNHLELAGQQALLPAANWTMNLLVHHLSPTFPTQDLSSNLINSFLRNHAAAHSSEHPNLTSRDLRRSISEAARWRRSQNWCPTTD